MKRRSLPKQRVMPAPGRGYRGKVERAFRGCMYAPAPSAEWKDGRVVLNRREK